ncbi:MAG: radical SAM protein [Desulfovibrionaceae bacterium]|nr:radical SAM protein [Desulfovibrionaceae bacterium]
MKNLYFVQASYAMGNNAYLPYTYGCLAACVWKNPLITSSYRNGGCFFLRDPVDAVLDKMENPKAVAFSCYAWNYEYHKALAAAIKKRWPECSIIFGGHQILNCSSEQMEICAAIDYLVHGAGEVPLERLLVALLKDGDVSRVPSVSYRLPDGKIHRNPSSAQQCPPEDLPSPYLEGYFDPLLEQYSRLIFSATLETNRGCPYHCAFCDWGDETHKLRNMPMERILAEIEWCAKRRIEVLFCADSNFGIQPRDEEIADAVIAAKNKYGYPKKLIASYDKGTGDIPFRINEKLQRAGLSAGATLAFQTTDSLALENIGRSNLTFGQYRDVMLRYNEKGIPAYAEFIVGLPGETFDSFVSGIDQVLGGSLCASIEAFPCELLPNTPMAQPAYIERHQLQLVKMRRTQRHQSLPPADDIPEYATIVVGTATMPREDWVRALLFSDFVQAFHGCRLLTLAAIFLNAACRITFADFYAGLIDFAQDHPQTLLGELLPRFRARLSAFSQGDGKQILLCDPLFGDIMYPLAEALFLYCATQPVRFFSELPLFLERYGLGAELQAELIAYQHLMAVLPDAAPAGSHYFRYDWSDFFAGYYAGTPKPLQARPNRVVFRQVAISYAWPEFAKEFVWYGRKKGALVRKGYEVLYD